MRTLILASVLVPVLLGRSAEAQTITFDPSTTYQTMNGWEATAFVAEPSDPAFPNFKDEVYDRLVNDLGINRIRLEVRSGVEHTTDNWSEYQAGNIDYQTWRATRYATVNDNGDANTIDPAGFHFSELDWHIENIVIPLRALAQARGEQLYINCPSPISHRPRITRVERLAFDRTRGSLSPRQRLPSAGALPPRTPCSRHHRCPPSPRASGSRKPRTETATRGAEA